MIICQQTITNVGSVAAASQKLIHDQRKYVSCPSAAWVGVPASPGACDRSLTASDVVSDHRHSRPSKQTTPHSRDFAGKWGPENKEVNEGVNHIMMSGISRAMINDETHTRPEERMDETDEETLEQAEDDYLCILPASPTSRVAFHEPPLLYLYPDEIDRAELPKSPFVSSLTGDDVDNAVDESIDNIVVELASSPTAIPSLLQRCTLEGSPRLKMFHRKRIEDDAASGNTAGVGDGVPEFNDAIKDQLSDFKSFRTSHVI